MNLTTHDIRVLTERFVWAVAAGVRPADWIRLHAKLDTNELNALFTELRREWAEFGHDDGTMDALKAALTRDFGTVPVDPSMEDSWAASGPRRIILWPKDKNA